MITESNITYNVFLSHSHNDAEPVGIIAGILEDAYNIKVWLDKWILVPGEPFRQAMAKGIDNAKTCAVIVGNGTPKGWFEEEIGKALNRQSQDKSFRVIPVLLPGSDSKFITDFLELRTWVKFKETIDEKRPMHELVCGINGVPPGRQYEKDEIPIVNGIEIEDKLKKIKKLHEDNLIEDSIKLEFQRIILNELLLEKKK